MAISGYKASLFMQKRTSYRGIATSAYGLLAMTVLFWSLLRRLKTRKQQHLQGISLEVYFNLKIFEAG